MAKNALVDRKRVVVKGDNWFSIPFFNQDGFEAFVELIEESDENISHIVSIKPEKLIYKFNLKGDSVLKQVSINF